MKGSLCLLGNRQPQLTLMPPSSGCAQSLRPWRSLGEPSLTEVLSPPLPTEPVDPQGGCGTRHIGRGSTAVIRVDRCTFWASENYPGLAEKTGGLHS